MRYFTGLSTGKLILWCYFLWYAFFVVRYFDASRNLWLTSLGISAIVGVALLLSTRTGSGGANARRDPWVVFRLFLMPFCVSSFSALVKGRGFALIFSPRMIENFLAIGLCVAFCVFVAGVKLSQRSGRRFQ